MNYHLLSGINKYLRVDKINKICSLDKYNNNFRNTYLYEMPIIRVKCSKITELLSKKYRYIIFDVGTVDEIYKIISYKIYIIGIFIESFIFDVMSIIGLPQTLKFLAIDSYTFNGLLDNLPRNLKSLEIKKGKYDKPLNNLPDTLEKLIIKSEFFEEPLDNLPKSLKILNIRKYHIRQDLNNLPKTLKYLILNTTELSSIKTMPRSLKLLEINGKKII